MPPACVYHATLREVFGHGSTTSFPTAFRDFDFADGHFGLAAVRTGRMWAVGRPGPEKERIVGSVQGSRWQVLTEGC